jgi:hypothetical protein
MEDQVSLIGTLFEKTDRYARTSAELYRLKAIEKSADIISTFSARLVIMIFITLFFLILNIGLSLWIGEVLGKTYHGFFIVSGFYAMGAVVLFIFRRKWIQVPIRNAIITQALN